jgi:hypothetical protein
MARFRPHLTLRRLLVSGGLAVCLLGGAVVASATPPSGVVSAPILSRGTLTQDLVIGAPVTRVITHRVKVRVRGRTFIKRVKVKVKSVRPLMTCSATRPCDTAFQEITINPGGYTGWHTHPGLAFVSTTAGEGTLYHAGAAGAGCPGDRYPTGTGFSQPSEDVHNLRNEGSAPLSIHAFYVLPSGTPNTAIRTDQAQPPNCPNIP